MKLITKLKQAKSIRLKIYLTTTQTVVIVSKNLFVFIYIIKEFSVQNKKNIFVINPKYAFILDKENTIRWLNFKQNKRIFIKIIF